MRRDFGDMRDETLVKRQETCVKRHEIRDMR